MPNNNPETSKPLFSSRRERRLWGWTLAVVAAIYATLGLASTLAKVPQNLAAVFFLAGMLLVALTVLTQGLQVRPRGLEIRRRVGCCRCLSPGRVSDDDP